MSEKVVLQYGNLAGWPFTLAEALTEIGQPSINVIPEDRDFSDLKRRLPFHEAVADPGNGRLIKASQRLGFLLKAPTRFSLVHYHASHILRGRLHHLFEGPYLRSFGIPMLASFSGSDARILSLAAKNNPYFFREPDAAHDLAVHRYLKSISRNIRFAATDCEMAEYVSPYFEHVFTFRQPIVLANFNHGLTSTGGPPVLLHVPTDTEVKGTSHIVAAVDRLRMEGLEFDFRTMRHLTQSQLHREIEKCDVYVDELRCGSYGVTATEAMAAGKPAVTYIRRDLLDKYPSDLPIVNANPDTIYDELRKLIVDPAYRARKSKAGRAYVEKYHDARVVARDMLAIYKQIGLQ